MALRDVTKPAEEISGDSLQRIVYVLDTLEQQLENKTIELAKNREHFDAVLSGMVEGVIAIDESQKVVLINRAARAILALDTMNVIGKPVSGLVRYEEVQNAIHEAFETGKTVSLSFKTHDPHPREVRLRVAPMAGKPRPGMTLVFHDVTELARLETIRRDFVANVSHELKTPLVSIKGYAETLLMGAIDKAPENRRFLQQIDHQAEVLNRQIHDLLQLARIESGREAFSYEAVDLLQVCQDNVNQFVDEAAKRHIQLIFENRLSDDGCFVWADPDAMKTVFDNLISNALRYSRIDGRTHEPMVRVVIRSDDTNAIVEVIDNGIGIAREHQERVFERFFRVDPARSREQGGTGLGLSIVKHLLQSFGGQIELDSKPGLGSTFRAVLPRFRPQE